MSGDNILAWPQAGEAQVVFIVLWFVALLLVFLFVRWIYLRSGRRDARWAILMQYALRQRVRGDDLKLLRRFYDQLNDDDSVQVVTNRVVFHSRLHDFLRDDSRAGIVPRERVRILDSLFPVGDAQLEVKSLRDLQAGEVCSLEFGPGPETHLSTILKLKEEELWIRVHGWQAPAAMKDVAARVYVFRHNLGGFLLDGRILRAEKELVVFGGVQRITSYGNQHLMAEIEVPLVLYPWPPPTAKPLTGTQSDATSAQPTDAPGSSGESASGTPPDVVRRPVSITGTTHLISDRALLFFTEDQAGTYDFHLLEGQEVWEIDLVLPRGFALRCRGVVLPSGKGGRGRWLFKYLDADENQRRAIFEEIKLAGAKREKLV